LIIYEDADYIAIDKPPGHHVHPPENKRWRVPRELICLYWVRDYLGEYVYPIHRLDAATGGVVLFGKRPEAAGKIQELIQTQKITKNYVAVTRGYTTETGIINRDLLSDSSESMLPSLTHFAQLAKIELPYAVGKKHASSRYSLLKVEPKTGRYHQIRRHLASLSHPIVGDIKHGDSHHNRFFREELKISGLLLHSFELSFTQPFSGINTTITTLWGERWKRVFELFHFDSKLNSAEKGLPLS
jgi:tRNA pseudouridine65 synthase